MIVPSQQALATALGVSTATIRTWVMRGMPRLADGYDVEAVAAWREAQGDARTTDGRTVTPMGQSVTQGQQWRNEKAKLEAAKLALEVRKMRGELIDRQDVVEMLRARATALDRLLRSRNRRLADKLAGKSAAEIFQLLHTDTLYLTEIYRKAPTLAEVSDPESDVDLEEPASED